MYFVPPPARMRLYSIYSARPYPIAIWVATWFLFAIGVIAPVVVSFGYVTFISGTSMWPLLKEPCAIFGSRLGFHGETVDRGDLLAFETEIRGVVKRVIGLPGDTVILAAGRVYVLPKNETIPQLLYEPYLATGAQETYLDSGPPNNALEVYQTPPDHFFVLADNRSTGSDSRSYVMDGHFPTPFVPFYAVDTAVYAAYCRDGWKWLFFEPGLVLQPIPASFIGKPTSRIRLSKHSVRWLEERETIH